ncbi:MAG: nuclear transport factor 2 family protein [Gemmatimonadota bacterium]|nr:nuclear transport factor 2 family protein [Gemmatimonadota bacterium]
MRCPRTGPILLAVVFLFACSPPGGDSADGSPGAEPDMTQSNQAADNEQVIVDFIEAWSRLDPTELAGFFTEDGVYHNMPSQPVQGRANVEALIRGFSATWTQTTWDILNIMSSGNVVIAERVDRTRAGDRSVDLPVVGVFEMEAGKIKVWRDYFDLGTYTTGMN